MDALGKALESMPTAEPEDEVSWRRRRDLQNACQARCLVRIVIISTQNLLPGRSPRVQGAFRATNVQAPNVRSAADQLFKGFST